MKKKFIFRNRECDYELNAQDKDCNVVHLSFYPNVNTNFIDSNGHEFFYVTIYNRKIDVFYSERDYENVVIDDDRSYFNDSITDEEYDYIKTFIDSLLEDPEPTTEPEPIPVIETKKYLLKISYSWGDEKSDIEFSTWEEAWETAKKYAMKEADDFSREHEDTTSLVIEQGKITLIYHAWNECCYYNVMEA